MLGPGLLRCQTEAGSSKGRVCDVGLISVVVSSVCDEPMLLPRLYPIVDLGCFGSAADPVMAATRFTEELLRGGATLIQLRDKSGDWPRFLSCARELRRVTRGRARLIINDRADLAVAADADGVHLGQDDLSPEAVRKMFDSLESHPLLRAQETEARSEQRMGHPASLEKREPPSERMGHLQQHPVIGYSTHNLGQVKLADQMAIDYLAVGPVFATSSKTNPDPVIGVAGVRQAAGATSKPAVAIGGITRQNCLEVIQAGAQSVAVISDLLDSPAKAVEEFMRILE